MGRSVYRHAGPRRRTSWWRGPWPPTILLAVMTPLLIALIFVVVSG